MVATGPGGFTGTRLTVVLARTLAQQLQIPLHGFGSFLPMAHRLAEAGVLTGISPGSGCGKPCPDAGSLRGYRLDDAALGGILETDEPRLFRPEEEWPGGEPGAPAEVDAEQDVLQLLALGRLAHAAALPGPWETVLPLYPTSPVDGHDPSPTPNGDATPPQAPAPASTSPQRNPARPGSGGVARAGVE